MINIDVFLVDCQNQWWVTITDNFRHPVKRQMIEGLSASAVYGIYVQIHYSIKYIDQTTNS